jgi:signal transduction histidine kinase
VLQIAFLVVGLLLAYQLIVTLLQPTWIGPVTDWLLTLVAWPGLLGVVLLSLWLTRTGQPEARSWWLVSGGLLAHALARTLWLVEDVFLFRHQAPIPSLADLFFTCQYLFFLLALLLLPAVHPGIRRARVALDACLLLGSALALSWYFLLAPIFQDSQETGLARLVALSYPLGALAVSFGLTVLWLRSRAYAADRVVLVLFFAAITCLVVADIWKAVLLLKMPSLPSGSPPDLFWLAFYLLLLLASLVRFRLTRRELAGARARQRDEPSTNVRQHDLLAGLRIIFPVAAALLTSAVLFIRAEQVANVLHPVAPPLIALALLALALVRQGLTAIDSERLRREREEALQETTAQMETFLGIAGHELKNPLASMQLCLQVVERRIRRLLERERIEVTDETPFLEPVAQAQRQQERLHRLVDDLVDVTRIRAGRLDLHLAPTDLAPIVREAVQEQRQIHQERTLVLEYPENLQVPVTADAYRLGQVVTNYLTNALKYSPAEQPITVGLQMDEQQARLWVRDAGPGLPPGEQEHIWKRFHRAHGIEAQSGSGGGLGLGLHISKTIIEQHQGQVGVQSARGAGSTFWFSLPLVTPAPARQGSESGAPEGQSLL